VRERINEYVRSNAKNLIDTTNLALEDIARCVKLPLTTVEELAHGRTA